MRRILLTLTFLALAARAQPPMFEGAQGAAWSAGQNLEQKKLLPFRKTSTWRFSAGPSVRSLGGTSWKTGSSIRLRDHATTTVVPGSAGVAGGRDHQYSDGYVHPDAGTPIDGHTAFFGFDNSSQDQGNVLVFHGDGGTASTFDSRVIDAGGGTDLNGFAPSFQATWLARELTHNQEVIRGGLSLDLSLFSTSPDRSPMTEVGTWNDYHVTVTDRYTIAPGSLPAAPYHGTNSGLGPVINTTPADRSETTQLLDTHHYRAFANQSLDLFLTAISIGPTLEWEHRRRFAMQVSMGLALNIASWDASQTDTVTVDHHPIASVEHQDSGLKLLPGLYLLAAANLRLSEEWWLVAFGRYDWCGGIEGDVGPSHFHADLGGWTSGIALERHY